MKVGVISDTHISAQGGDLPGTLLNRLRGVDLILHAGDLVVLEVLEALQAIAPVEAVAGNMDSAEVKERLPSKRIIPLEDLYVGLIHGWGSPWGLPERVSRQFAEDVDVVVFGHSHRPWHRQVDEKLLFNPGSAGKSTFSRNRSYGILNIEGDRIWGEIVQL
jgi:putative phosphoesterase